MKTISTTMVAFLLATGVCHADDSDDTLRLYLSKSDLAVLGTIVSEPMGILTEAGVPNYICEFTVSEVCKGDAKLKGTTMKVNIKRFEMDRKDRHPLIKKDAECILFLKKEIEGNAPEWTASDFWFGIQHPSPWMARSLKRLEQQTEDTAKGGRKFLLGKWRAGNLEIEYRADGTKTDVLTLKDGKNDREETLWKVIKSDGKQLLVEYTGWLPDFRIKKGDAEGKAVWQREVTVVDEDTVKIRLENGTPLGVVKTFRRVPKEADNRLKND